MAAFANLHATDAGHARVNQLYDDASRALGIALAVSFVFLFLFADQAVIIWTGEAYPTASWTLRALAIGQLPHALTAVGTASLRARGRLGLELAFAGLRAALLALCVLPMYWAWGYGGVVATCSAAAVISSFAFFLMFARVEDFDLTGFARLSLWWPARALAPATLASLALSSAALVPLCFTNVRYQTCLEVAVYGLVFALVAMTGVWFNVLSGTERRAVVALVAQRLDTAA
jgi:O-antigen/teichoic acid export membrane protein